VLNEIVDGWSLFIDGLESGQNYNITIVAKNDTQTLTTFHTATATVTEADPETEEIAEGIEQITNHKSQITNKVLRDGVLYIERNDKTYNARGAEMR
jgi:phage terminase large subunit-like protein